MNTKIEKSFEEMAADPVGTIYADWMDEDVRCLIIKGTISLCAYFGIPKDHPMAGKKYNEIPLDVHGGLTFSKSGDGIRPRGFYWFGWDYGQVGVGDCLFVNGLTIPGKKWKVSEIKEEMNEAIVQFKKLMKDAKKSDT